MMASLATRIQWLGSLANRPGGPRTIWRLAVVITLLTGASPTLAQTTLVPFSAEYRLYINKIPMPIKGELTLEHTQGDEYTMRLHSKSLLLKNTEESRFQWQDCQPRPLSYFHEFKGLGRHNFHTMTFSWDEAENEKNHALPYPVVINEADDGTEVYPITQDTMDDLTMLLRARCVFAEGAKEFLAVAAYGNRVRVHLFQLEGEEEIKTPEGPVNALRIVKFREKEKEEKRRTLFWIAPSLDYLIVRATHVENAALQGTLMLRSIDFADAVDSPDRTTQPAP